VVNLIGSTQTTKGLTVDCEIDEKEYETGINITTNKMHEINLVPSSFHGEWNYCIFPK
jgi:hypothetical protein